MSDPSSGWGIPHMNESHINDLIHVNEISHTTQEAHPIWKGNTHDWLGRAGISQWVTSIPMSHITEINATWLIRVRFVHVSDMTPSRERHDSGSISHQLTHESRTLHMSNMTHSYKPHNAESTSYLHPWLIHISHLLQMQCAFYSFFHSCVEFVKVSRVWSLRVSNSWKWSLSAWVMWKSVVCGVWAWGSGFSGLLQMLCAFYSFMQKRVEFVKVSRVWNLGVRSSWKWSLSVWGPWMSVVCGVCDSFLSF